MKGLLLSASIRLADMSTPKNHDPRIGDRYHPGELISRTLRSNVTLLHNLLCISTVGMGDYGTVLYWYCVSFPPSFWKAFSDGSRRRSTATLLECG